MHEMMEQVTKTSNKHAYSPLAEKMGLGAFAAAAILLFVDLRLAIIPLFVFVLVCLTAPFLPRVSFFLPIISKGRSGRRAVSLTFDDGPEPGTTPGILRLLQTYHVQATFFVTGQKAARHPDLIREILSRGHHIGNHSYRHDNLIMLKSAARLRNEIEATQAVLKTFGIKPVAFRPPVGITNPKLGPILHGLGMVAVNFSCKGSDIGNRRIQGLANRTLKRVKPDAIIVLHDTLPRQARDAEALLQEIDGIISGLNGNGFQIRPLRELIGRPIMCGLEEGDEDIP